MINVRTKPNYFQAHQWDGTPQQLNTSLEIVVLDRLLDPAGRSVGVVIHQQQPVCNIVQGLWIVFSEKGVQQICGDDHFKNSYDSYDVIDVFATDAVILLPYSE